MNQSDPTLLELAEVNPGAAAEKAAALIDFPLDLWDGNCHGVSARVAPLVGGVVRRGYFHGELGANAHFRSNVQQHSWIELADLVESLDLDPRAVRVVNHKLVVTKYRLTGGRSVTLR